MTNFGMLKKEDVRKHWPHEALDFTRWLAQEENLTSLGQAIGRGQLEIIQTEAPVGPYSADILAKNSSGERVVIENQFGKTDHGHLGKSLTYASVLNAKTIIWIAEEFTEEHQRTVGWLNDLTSEDFSFYAVKLEVWKIDDSRPAFNFKVLVQPAQVKPSAVLRQTTLSEYKLKQEKFWKMFSKRLSEKQLSVKPRKPEARNLFRVITSDGCLSLPCVIDIERHTISLYVRLSENNAKRDFEQLFIQKESIEKELGEQLEWDGDAKFNRMIMLRWECDFACDADFEYGTDYLTVKIENFIHVFKQRVHNISVDTQHELEEFSGQDED